MSGRTKAMRNDSSATRISGGKQRDEQKEQGELISRHTLLSRLLSCNHLLSSENHKRANLSYARMEASVLQPKICQCSQTRGNSAHRGPGGDPAANHTRRHSGASNVESEKSLKESGGPLCIEPCVLAQNTVQRRLANLDRTPGCEPDDIHSAGVLRRAGVVGRDLGGADGSCLVPVA